MDHADGGDDDVFIYTGGNQRVPRNVRYVRVHKSVKIITERAKCRISLVTLGPNVLSRPPHGLDHA